jgi:hypothetical protein
MAMTGSSDLRGNMAWEPISRVVEASPLDGMTIEAVQITQQTGKVAVKMI